MQMATSKNCRGGSGIKIASSPPSIVTIPDVRTQHHEDDTGAYSTPYKYV